LSLEYRNSGFLLYTAIPLTYVTGFYRYLGCTNFVKEMSFGFVLDILETLALLFLQGLNNSTLNSNTVQKDFAIGYF
jgi:hypothetical protein